MLHPFFSTLISRPDLVADHLAGYGVLVREEVLEVGVQWIKRLVAWVLAGLFVTLFLIFLGVATMLGVMHGEMHWILAVVPGTTLVLAVIAVAYAKRASPVEAFAGLHKQLSEDVDALKTAGAHA